MTVREAVGWALDCRKKMLGSNLLRKSPAAQALVRLLAYVKPMEEELQALWALMDQVDLSEADSAVQDLLANARQKKLVRLAEVGDQPQGLKQ